MSISRLTLVGSDCRLNSMLVKKLHCYCLRSIFRQKSPFCTLFWCILPPILPANRLCERLGPAACCHSGKEGGHVRSADDGRAQSRPARSTPGEPGRAADRQAFAAWFQRRSQLRGVWGRRPKGDAPRSEAGALGARWLSPARPQPPCSCHPRRSGS